jgi:hypothetical protein
LTSAADAMDKVLVDSVNARGVPATMTIEFLLAGFEGPPEARVGRMFRFAHGDRFFPREGAFAAIGRSRQAHQFIREHEARRVTVADAVETVRRSFRECIRTEQPFIGDTIDVVTMSPDGGREPTTLDLGAR